MDTVLDLITAFGWWPQVVQALTHLPWVGDWLLRLVLFLWVFWGVYVLVMGVYRAHLSRRLSKAGYAFGLPWVALGYALDFLANVIVATLIFLELPREALVTTRLQRHINSPTSSWRTAIAVWVCDEMLDVFDPSGNHC